MERRGSADMMGLCLPPPTQRPDYGSDTLAMVEPWEEDAPGTTSWDEKNPIRR